MGDYRYIFADLLTNKVNMELPLFSVNFNRELNKAGNFQGFWKLGVEGFDDRSVIEATETGRTALYIERNGALVWGGIIWARTWQENSSSFQYNGQTFESFFKKQDIREHLIYNNVEQRDILVDLIRHMQQDQYANLNIIVPDETYTTGVFRNLTFYEYESWRYSKAIELLTDHDLGIDYTIEPVYDSSGKPAKVLRMGQPLGAQLATSNLIFDYPGNVRNFWYPENASRAATDIRGVGAGEGSTTIRAWSSNIPAGHPRLTEVYVDKAIKDVTTLRSHMDMYYKRIKVPISIPKFEIYPDAEPQLGSYGLGDWAKFYVQSKRFPDVEKLTARIIGWEVTAGGEESEDVKLIVEEEEGGESD